MAKREMVWKCPFCKVGEIEILYFPSMTRPKKGPWGGSKPFLIKSAESLIVKTEKCPKCGKSQKEIEKAFIEGKAKQVSHKERLKHLQESGLPMRIETRH